MTRSIVAQRTLHLLLSGLLGLALSGCGPDFTPEQAQTECNRLRNDLAACFNDAVYEQCVSCHETCGRECSLLDSCPHQFVCDE